MKIISVLMPAYNSEKFIEQAINSVLAQTYSNFELIICDDNSLDNTVKIVMQYCDLDKRVKLVKNKYKKGAAGARNTCLDYATGYYVSFLDSDDYWGTGKLKEQYEFMESNNISFSHANYFMFNDTSVSHIVSRSVIDFKKLTYTCDIGCLTVMVRRDLLKAECFPYLPKEDYALWLDILKKDGVSCNAGNLEAYYRKSTSSASGNKIKEINKQYIVLKSVSGLPLPLILLRLVTYIYYAVKKHYLNN